MSRNSDARPDQEEPQSQPFPSINIDHVPDPAITTRTRKRAGTLSQVASAFIPVASFDGNEKSPTRTQPDFDLRKPSKARNGHLKLILHVLEALENRPRALHIYNGLTSDNRTSDTDKVFDKLAQSVKDAVTSRPMSSRSNTLREPDSDEDERPEDNFYTDETLTRMEELKEVLLVAKSQGWHLFDDGGVDTTYESNIHAGRSFGMRRSSVASSRRVRSQSPTARYQAYSSILTRCLDILSSVVLEDCRFRISRPRPKRPPHMLQHLTLNIARLLASFNWNRPETLSRIGLIMIPAFYSFPQAMHTVLLEFFEGSLILPALRSLKGLQQPQAISESQQFDEYSKISATQVEVEIQVEATEDDRTVDEGITSIRAKSLSTNAPAQSLDIYHLSSTVAPLLAAICENLDFASDNLTRCYHLNSLLRTILDLKQDSCLDILEVIAYHTDRARYNAISIMSTFWPRSFGRTVISKPFPSLTYRDAAYRMRTNRSTNGEPHYHEFIPWYFSPSSMSSIFEGSSFEDCHACGKSVNGCGLFCSICSCVIHNHCWDAPEGSCVSHYQVNGTSNKVALYRFSRILPEDATRGETVIYIQPHVFTHVNMYTLTLCAVCKLPLWGYVAQGYHCNRCDNFVHGRCARDLEHNPGRLDCRLSEDIARISINSRTLRASFREYYEDILFTEPGLSRLSFEEIALCWTFLSLQLEIMQNGIAAGSIILVSDHQDDASKSFEAETFVTLYEKHLLSGRYPPSALLSELFHYKPQSRNPHMFLFNLPALQLLCSTLKSPAIDQQESSGLLHVRPPSDVQTEDEEDHVLQAASYWQLCHILSRELQVHHSTLANGVIRHLHMLGFIDFHDIMRHDEISINASKPREDVMCTFRIPLGLDNSIGVESLIAAVEACLKSLDLSMNEAGFLLLARKLWPNELASEYALTRLARAVIEWILSEDEVLIVILRERVAMKQNGLPGVPLNAESTSWPRIGMPSGSMSNGNDYLVYRHALRSRYACRWLSALHAMDIETYAKMLYEICSSLATEAEDTLYSSVMTADGHPERVHSAAWADKTLKYLGKLFQAAVAFSAVDEIFLSWLEDVKELGQWKHHLGSLDRLVNREIEGSSRATYFAMNSTTEQVIGPLLDPWRIMGRIASVDLKGLRKVLNWLRIFAASGVDIPVSTFTQISNCARDLDATFNDDAQLCEIVLLSAWMKSLGRHDLQKVITDIHWRNASTVLDAFGNQDEEGLLRYLRHSLGAMLLLFGCDRVYLTDKELVWKSDIEFLPSRRKHVRRASGEFDKMPDIDIVSTLADYIDTGTDQIRCYVAKVLVALLKEATALNQQEKNAFISENCSYLTRCAWKLYEVSSTVLDELRPALLVHVLVVDPGPFEEIIEESFRDASPWHTRLDAVTRLFRMILDTTSTVVDLPDKPWRSAMISVFYRFFSCVWAEEQEDIRVAADTWSRTLQANHLQAVADCFSESLSRSPMLDRIRLVSFLLHLRSHFPAWRVLSWKIIVDTLMDDFSQRIGDAEESPAAAHLSMYGISISNNISGSETSDPEAGVLQSSLLLLSLQMIADGVPIDIFSLLRVKFHLAIALGFTNASLIPAQSGHSFHVQLGDVQKYNDYALTCIDGLLLLLDANRVFALPLSAMTGTEDDSTVDLLIGSIMIDLFLGLFNDEGSMSKLPILTQKVLLQSMAVVVLKHDMDRSPLNHLQSQLRRAIRKVTELLPLDISYELRHLCLSVLQATLKRWPAVAIPSLVNQVYNMTQLMHQLHVRTDDALVNQAATLLETIFVQYSTTTSSVLYQLCKRELDSDSFTVIRHVLATRNSRTHSDLTALRNVILEGALVCMADYTNEPSQAHIHENVKKFVELVHHQGFSYEFMNTIGHRMLQLFRKASGASEEQHNFNPNPAISMATTILRHNKAHSRDFIVQLEQCLQVALVRFDVQTQTLRELLRVTSALYKRAGLDHSATNGNATKRHSNVIINLLVDTLSEVFRSKVRTAPVTLVALVEALLPSPCLGVDQDYLTPEHVASLGSDTLLFLHSSAPTEIHQDRELTTSLAVSVLALQAIRNDTSFFGKQLGEHIYEKSGRHALSVRVWNVLLLKAIQIRSKTTNQRLIVHLSDFSPVYHTSLQRLASSIGNYSEISATDINQAYISIKLWLLLARSCATDVHGEPESVVTVASEDSSNNERSAVTIWNELWPPFERLLYVYESDAASADASPIASFIYTSIANVLLFIRQLRSVIAMEMSAHIATLRKVKSLVKGEPITTRLSRAIQSLSDPPPEVSFEALVNQATQELLAAEKLHAAEMRRETGRTAPERNRRDIRFATS